MQRVLAKTIPSCLRSATKLPRIPRGNTSNLLNGYQSISGINNNSNILPSTIQRLSSCNHSSFSSGMNGDNNKNTDSSKRQGGFQEDSGRFFSFRTPTSSHYVIDEKDIISLLNKFNLPYKAMKDGQQLQIEWCPFCGKSHNNDPSNSYTLGISKQSGQFNCFRCGIKGSFWDFKNLLWKNVPLDEFRSYQHTTQNEPTMDDSEFFLYHQQLINKEQIPEEIAYLTGKSDSKQRHLDYDTLVKYKVGVGKEEFANREGNYIKVPVAYFPMFRYQDGGDKDMDEQEEVNPIAQKFKNSSNEKQAAATSQPEANSQESPQTIEQNTETNKQQIEISTDKCRLVKCKIRGLGPQNKKYMRVKPSGSKAGIFGLNTIPENAQEIVITEGEYDAMAVFQATGLPAISLPNGASNLPVEIIKCLERFKKIYLWLDNDEVGMNSRTKLAEKLGSYRTYIVQTAGEKDANDILRKDPSKIMEYIKKAQNIPDQSILHFASLKDSIKNRLLNYDENQGVKSRRFEFYNNSISGLRNGELTVLTGPTGSGKTTFLSQLSLDFCQQRVPTLWGSFEIKNEILASNMMMQMSGLDLTKQMTAFPYWSDRFEELPLYFMSFFGSTNLEKVLQTIEYAIYMYDVQHVIIDNLQFLLGTQARGFDKFDLQDKAIEAFRQLTTRKNIHMTLVVHPKKVEDGEDLNISSVFGSAKATQEADNVVILQNRERFRVIEVKKNRYNGDLCRHGVIFDKANKNFYEISFNEAGQVSSGKKAAVDIVKEKRQSYHEKIEAEHSGDQQSQTVEETEHLAKKGKKDGNNGDNNDGGNDNNNNNNGGNDNNQGGNNSNNNNNNNNNNSNTNNSTNPQSMNSEGNKKQTVRMSENPQVGDAKAESQKKNISSSEKEKAKASKNASDSKKSKKENEEIINKTSDPETTKVATTNSNQQSGKSNEKEFLSMEEVDEQINKATAEQKAIDSLSTGKFVSEEEISLDDALMMELIQKEINSPHQQVTSHHQSQSLFEQENQHNQSGVFAAPQKNLDSSKKQQFKPEKYDSDPLEPIDFSSQEPVGFDMYQKIKKVPVTQTFFKTKTPIPEKEIDNLIGRATKTDEDIGMKIVSHQVKNRANQKSGSFSENEMAAKFNKKS